MATTIVGVTELANVLGISTRRIQQLAKEGVIPKAGHGKFNVDAARQAYKAYLDGAVSGGDLDSDNDKARLLKAQADRAEYEAELARLKVDEQSGALIPAEEVAEAWGKLVSNVKAKLLTVPSAVAPELFTSASAQEIEAGIRAAISAALTELSETEVPDAPSTPADSQ